MQTIGKYVEKSAVYNNDPAERIDTDAIPVNVTITTTNMTPGDTFISPNYLCEAPSPPPPPETLAPNPSVIPEPATLLLFGIGLIGILAFMRKKLKRKN